MIRKKADLQIRSVIDLLQSLHSQVLTYLYGQPAVCIILLRELSLEEQTIIMRLLFVDQPFSVAGVNAWFLASSEQANHGVDFSQLLSLKVFSECKTSVTPTVVMNDDFRTSLKSALGGLGAPWDLPTLPPDPKIPQKTVANLNAYAIERWESLLQFMVGSEGSREKLSDETIGILQTCGLIELDLTESPKPSLTASGFQFLLQETSAQVWYFLSQYFLKLNARDPDRLTESLTFVLQMSQAQLGREYSSENLSDTVMNFIQFLRELGLIYMRKRRDGRFYPTNLAVSFTRGSHATISLGDRKDISRYFEGERKSRNRDGFIVVESNFKVYAYTDSDLHVALIAMFSVICYRFPGCLCCVITRESIRQSLQMGISADKILHYLLSHLHPQAGNEFPPTVVDQLYLWEMETGKMTFTPGVLYSNFLSHAQFQFLHQYAVSLPSQSGHCKSQSAGSSSDQIQGVPQDPSDLVAGGVLYANSTRRMMVVDEASHEPVKKHWKANKSRFEAS